jgi:TonB family protein
MNSRAYILTVALIFANALRLPAPIVEPTENPTSQPEQETTKRAPKSKLKTAESSEEAKPAESAKPKVKHSKVKEKSEGDFGKAKPESESIPRPSGKARNLDGPKPIFPPEAAGSHLSGTGKYLLQFDQNTGLVTNVVVSQSAGSPLLDNSAITAFRQWHEDPHCAKEVTMTMTFGTAQQTAE